MSKSKKKTDIKQKIEHLERQVQVERIYDNCSKIQCVLLRICCPECRSASVYRNTGFNSPWDNSEVDRSKTVKFHCEICDFEGMKVYDKKTQNYVGYDEYCRILVEEI